MSELRPLLDLVAGTGVAPAEVISVRSLDRTEWMTLLLSVREQRITGLLLLAEEHGVVALTEVQRKDAEHAHLAAMATALRLERSLVETAALLESADVPFRVLKGAAVAHLDYPDPALRSFGDIDLLVPGLYFDATVGALLGAGGARPYAELRPGFDRRFGKGATIIAADGSEIDVHRTFVAGPFGMTIDFEALFSSRSDFTTGGVVLPALDDTHRFIHACYHAAIGRGTPRLVPVRDVAQMALSPKLDVDAVMTTAAEWRACAVVARAVSIAWERLRLNHITPLSVWAERYEPDPIEARMLTGYTGASWSFGAQAMAALRVIPGIRAKAAYAHALVLPRSVALETRRASRWRRWRRGARLAVRQVRGP